MNKAVCGVGAAIVILLAACQNPKPIKISILKMDCVGLDRGMCVSSSVAYQLDRYFRLVEIYEPTETVTEDLIKRNIWSWELRKDIVEQWPLRLV